MGSITCHSKNIHKIMINLPDSHIVAKFTLDGMTYDIEKFRIGFVQPTDFKGQPQTEVKGGQITLTIAQIADKALFEWVKRATSLKDGEITFQTDMGKSVLRVSFRNAYCVRLTREVNAMQGTSTTLMIAPEIVSLNDKEHSNQWAK